VADFPQLFGPFRAKWNPDRPKWYTFSGIVRRIEMTKVKLFSFAAVLLAVAVAPTLAEARHYRHHHHHWPLPYQISYLHNYGPGPTPGSFAYYDGPSTNHCYQGSSAYLGQDNRRHPCF
jgi:hypothetical protein